ncbi:hypothetical protein [Rubinisphaera margarita]|uniref:hypothetical protein n=1 Tax=Rubinisphaera margarita TaxID=2909586 RepID=UPI001EE81C0F|nr:hypothetical protein [Rubinisphaera margarita]MCG6157675.1 hypothetical protein [Rubinisphaera margarita]
MSLIGKFFVVMQILLSVTFMGFAATVFTYQNNYKTLYENETKAKTQIQAEKDNLQADFDKVKADMTALASQAEDRADRAEATNSALQAQLAELKQETERLSNSLQSQLALVKIAEDEAESRRSEAMSQRVVNTDLHKKLSDRIKDNRIAEDKMYGLNVEKENLTKKNKELIERLAFLEKVVRNNNLETDPRVYAAQNDPPPVVSGLVVNATTDERGAVDLVEISLGADDGLVRGHRLEVWRSGEDARYLGQIELVYVDTDHAVGRLVDKAKNGIIKKGDNVTSKL